MALDPKSTLYCSFCRKSQHEVKKLIAAPTVFICDECTEICADICREGGVFSILPKELQPDDLSRIRDLQVKSITHILQVGGLNTRKRTVTGEELLTAVVRGLYMASTPEGMAMLRDRRIEALEQDIWRARKEAQATMRPLRNELRQLKKAKTKAG